MRTRRQLLDENGSGKVSLLGGARFDPASPERPRLEPIARHDSRQKSRGARDWRARTEGGSLQELQSLRTKHSG